MNIFFTKETQLIVLDKIPSLTIREMNVKYKIIYKHQCARAHTHKHTHKADDTNVGQLGNNGKSNILWEVCKLTELLWKTIWHHLEKLIMYISQNPAIHSQVYNTSEKLLHNYT